MITEPVSRWLGAIAKEKPRKKQGWTYDAGKALLYPILELFIKMMRQRIALNQKTKSLTKKYGNGAKSKGIDVVVWTDLESNFKNKSKNKTNFSVESAIAHIQKLEAEGKAKAAEYVWRAPDFVRTELRTALENEPWFKKP